jgi:hypothetical protein
MAKRRKKARKRNGMNIHPSITGLGAGLGVAQALNSGYPSASSPAGHHHADSVTDNLQKGDITRAVNRLQHNSIELITNPNGTRYLTKLLGIAVVGAGIRKLAKNPKIGGTKFYFRI